MRNYWGAIVVAGMAMMVAGSSFAQESCDTDFNGDGTTDPADVEIFKAAFGSAEGDENYNAATDLNGDGYVTTIDYAILLDCN